jgi:hypothetical protein
MDGAQIETVFSLTVNNGPATRVDLVRAPAKLSHARLAR